MRLTHYINRHTWDAFVSEETLAKDCRTNPRTVRRALADGKAFGIIERTSRGNQHIGPSHHAFKLSAPDRAVRSSPKVHRTDEAVHRTGQASAPDRRVPLTSEEHLIKLPTASSSGLDGPSSAVANQEANSRPNGLVPAGARSPDSKEGVGERGPEGPKSEPFPFPWIDRAFGSATQIYTVPKRPICSARPSEEARRLQVAAARAAMAAAGMDLSASRWRR